MHKSLSALISILFFGLSVASCSSIGDGKVDTVEAATIQVAVGAAMTSKPELIIPSYTVSTALLAVLDSDTSASVSAIDVLVGNKIDELNMDELTKQSMKDLVGLVKARILQEFPSNIAQNEKVLVVKQIVQIVHDTAAMRMAK